MPKYFCNYDDNELIRADPKEVPKKDQARHPGCECWFCPDCDYGVWVKPD